MATNDEDTLVVESNKSEGNRKREFKVFGVFEPAVHYFAGLVAGVAGVLAGHPLDTVKVRLQTQTQNKEVKEVYRGTIHCFSSIIRHEGVRGLFKGISSPLASLTVINSVVFGVYGNTTRLFIDQQSITTHFLSGCAAGFVQTAIISPTELLKLRMQVQIDAMHRKYRSPIDCIQKMVKQHGIQHLYRGVIATLARDIPSYGVYFASYDRMAKSLSCDNTSESLTNVQLLFAGGIAGVLSWVVNYPVDVIKSKFQSDDKFTSYMQTIKFTYKTEGYRGFFAGFNSTILRAFPTNAATFFAVEWTYRVLSKVQDAIIERRRRQIAKVE
uniref:Mitochondrial basic amino acids transporter n=1 Tax=Parascaris univalens TaxID=6257 RepID=A0A915C7Z9_PARUN